MTATMRKPHADQVIKTRRKAIFFSVLILCAVVLATLILHHVSQEYKQNELERYQQSMLQTLLDDQGEYDEHSIVLVDTNERVARDLAEKLNATLRITPDGSFATLTLSEDVTILEICQTEAYLADLPRMTIDYEARVSDLTADSAENEGEDGQPIPTRPTYAVSDSSYFRQTYLDYINMKNIWELYRGWGITVAVIDSGIDTDHPEFTGRISEYSYNATEDKIVKDYLLPDGSYDWSLIEDEQGHGTSVTGVLAASMNDGEIVGVAPEATILVIKAECDASGAFKRTSDLVFGLYYAIERDASVVNMSFGGPGDRETNPYRAATQLAVDSDVICVAAAGNDATAELMFPAADENVLSVGALGTNSWELANYSNYGENVDIVAPGTTYTAKMGGGYAVSNGTSMASPVVAGAIALYMNDHRYTEFAEVREIVFASCRDLGSLGCDWYYGYGALDVSALILEERGKITFNMLTDELENTEQIFIREHTLQNIPEPERLYAVFDGWYYDPQCTEPYDWYADVFTADLTLYAHWVNEEDGVPYTYVELDDGTIEIRSYTGHRRYVTIPSYIDGKVVSSIGDSAFAGETGLREVTLPKLLTKIGRAAFSGCSNLLHIEIPDTVKTVDASAFADNVRLAYVAFGSGSQLESIGNQAFKGCSMLRSITLPASLRQVNGSAFFGTTSMISFDVHSQSTTFTAADGVLLDRACNTVVAYPAGLNGAYTLPKTVRYIGESAFGYAKLTELALDGVEVIGQNAFAYSRLERVSIPDSVGAMGKGAFLANAALRELTLGGGLTSVPQECFAYCTMLRSVEIPTRVQKIDKSAFQGACALEALTFAPNSQLLQIDQFAFCGTCLKTVTLPASLSVIGESAFSETSLSSVTFESGSVLQQIDKEAFSLNRQLASVTLPDSLKQIGDYAFLDTALQSVKIPVGLSEIGCGSFAHCHALTSFSVDPASTHFDAVDGVLFTKDLSTLAAYPAGKSDTEYHIPGGTVTIGDGAFYGAWNLNFVDVTASVRVIGEQAFRDCENVSDYSLNEGLTNIEREAFAVNTSLYAITIPNSVIQISNYAFRDTTSLTVLRFGEDSQLPRISYGTFYGSALTSLRIPASVSTIAQSAFEGCSELQEVTFAANSRLESISAYLFRGCEHLRQITFEEGSALTSIQAHAFDGLTELVTLDLGDAALTNIDNFAFRFCENLTSFEIPEGVTNIGRYAFYGCYTLEEVKIPESVEHIGRFAFLGASSVNLYFSAETLPAYLDEDWDHGIKGYFLGVSDVVSANGLQYAVLASGNVALIKYEGSDTQIDLNALDLGGAIVNIGGDAFAYSKLESVVLPDTLVNIQAKAFYHTELKSVTIPAGVKFIGKDAFADTPIASLTFAPESVLTVIEQSAFANTPNLQSVSLPASLTTLGRAVFKQSGIRSVTFGEGIAITEIPEEAFAYSALTSVTLPDSVSLINHGAFREIQTLKSVTFGNAAELRVMSNAFYRTGLESLTVPANMTYIGEYAFVALSGLQSFSVDESNPYYRATDGLLTSKDGRKLISVPAGITGSLTVPEGIEVIGFGAFEESRLSEVKFSKDANILSLGYRAFYNVQNITEIRIPASVVAIDYYAFANCTNLERVIFEENSSLDGIYEGAFYGCKKLSDIMLPDRIVEISDFAFYGCVKLDEVPISEKSELKGIYSYAMAYTGISGDFTLPESIIDIGDYALMGTKLTSVTLPNTNALQMSLGMGIFQNCTSLTDISLPFIGRVFEDNEITWVGYFFGAGAPAATEAYLPSALKTVSITGDISFIGKNAFDGMKWIERINLPDSIVMLYPFAFTGTFAEYELTGEISVEQGLINYYTMPFGDGMVGTLRLAEGLTAIETGIGGNIEHLVLPASLVSLNTEVYTTANDLRGRQLVSITVAEDNPNFASYEGILYDKTLTRIVAVPSRIPNDVTFPQTITEIPARAFFECQKLEHIVIPEGVTSIGEGAFSGCVMLTEITLPSTLTGIGNGAFQSCWSMVSVKNNSSMQLTFDSEENGGVAVYAKVIFEKDGSKRFREGSGATEYLETADGFRFLKVSEEYRMVAYLGDEETVRLPESVNGKPYRIEHMRNGKHLIIPGSLGRIDNQAFADNDSLQSVVIEDGITEIGQSAFADCSYLKRVQMPDSVVQIGSHAFGSCTDLEQINLSASLQTIENGVFFWCVSLKELIIPEGVTSIGDEAFRECMSLTELRIPQSVTEIAPSAFAYCSALEKLLLSESHPSYLIRNGIVYNRQGTQLVFVLPTVEGEVVIENGVTEIPTGAFMNLKAVTAVRIPDSVTRIGTSAFVGTSIQSITIPKNVTYIGSDALCCSELAEVRYKGDLKGWLAMEHDYNNADQTFDLYFGDQLVTEVEIPNGVTEIKNDTFSNCGITKVAIPNSVTKIGERAFDKCAYLLHVELPASVTEIADWAFERCDGLKSISVDGANPVFRSVDGVVYSKDLSEILIVPDGLQGMLEIPEGVRSIPDWSFESTDIRAVTLPSTLETIDQYAFANTNNLYAIYNNSNLTVEFNENGYCSLAGGVKMIVDRNGNKSYSWDCKDLDFAETQDGFFFVKLNGEYELAAYLGDKDTVTLPADFQGNPYSIYDMGGVINLVVPNSLKEISYSAFCNRKELRSVRIEDGVEYIGGLAFARCTNLRRIEIPDSVKGIGYAAFDGAAYAMSESNWTNGVLYYGKHLLEISEELEYFTVPEDVLTVCESAFSNCPKLKKLTVSGEFDINLAGLTNLETLVLTDGLSKPIREYFDPIPITLKEIALTDGVQVNPDTMPWLFESIADITIYVGGVEKDLRWNENFPGWNNGNRVIYGDKWITADFYSAGGALIGSSLFGTSQIVRAPWTDDYTDELYRYVFVGYDINGDGIADVIPATSTVAIKAQAVYERELRCNTEGHRYGAWEKQDATHHKRTCVCGEVETATHEYVEKFTDEGYLVSSATCEKKAIYYFACACGEKGTQTYEHGNLLSHLFESEFTKDENDHWYSCENCSAIKDKEAHFYGEWVVSISPTATEDGMRARYCIACGHAQQETIPATGEGGSTINPGFNEGVIPGGNNGQGNNGQGNEQSPNHNAGGGCSAVVTDGLLIGLMLILAAGVLCRKRRFG